MDIRQQDLDLAMPELSVQPFPVGGGKRQAAQIDAVLDVLFDQALEHFSHFGQDSLGLPRQHVIRAGYGDWDPVNRGHATPPAGLQSCGRLQVSPNSHWAKAHHPNRFFQAVLPPAPVFQASGPRAGQWTSGH